MDNTGNCSDGQIVPLEGSLVKTEIGVYSFLHLVFGRVCGRSSKFNTINNIQLFNHLVRFGSFLLTQ